MLGASGSDQDNSLISCLNRSYLYGFLDLDDTFGVQNASGQSVLIPVHGVYRKLKSFQVAQLVYDITVRFVDAHVDRFSRTRDQMVPAARSGVQNIAEGSQASATSKKTELKLTQNSEHPLLITF